MEQNILPFDDSSFVAGVEDVLEQSIQSNNLNETSAFIDNWKDFERSNPEFAKRDPSLHERCIHMQIRASWVAFPTLSENDNVDLIKNSLSAIFTIPFFNLQEKFRGYFAGIPLLEERDRIKQLFRKAMLENSEPLTTTTSAANQALTIGSWLNQYNQSTAGKIGTSIQRVQFLMRPLGDPLTEERKDQLRGIITAFDWLKHSSVNLESDTEVLTFNLDGQAGVWRGGEIEEIKVNQGIIEKIKKLGLLKEEDSSTTPLPAANQEEPLPVQAVQAGAPAAVVVDKTAQQTTKTSVRKSAPAVRAMAAVAPAKPAVTSQSQSLTTTVPQKSTEETASVMGSPSVLASNDVTYAVNKMSALPEAELLTNFYQALNEKNYDRTMAGLKVLATKGILPELMKKDSRLAEALASYYRRQQRAVDAESLKLSLTNPAHVKQLVKIILENQLKVKSSEAAHVAVDLVNLMNETGANKFSPWAYFDMETTNYKWL